ncbi:hypothetical protein [Alkaliphilus peptidifermentans]|uniref:Uncharacterized protein n=1 Tax=Alkaliphilus peptidifermentans DSM 18978 TaxID=1120976 RepID=A0A1G5ILC9_9FIRM|nr:hypothetical protein [Alkaliphilus peptidifermentans]SCY76389.1 hypothetical protein SAMN03080606_02423 [Alkaliphilus peptidifermentans DSM 18978]
MVEVIGSGLLVLVVYFYFDFQSKVNKLEKRVQDLENKINKRSE